MRPLCRLPVGSAFADRFARRRFPRIWTAKRDFRRQHRERQIAKRPFAGILLIAVFTALRFMMKSRLYAGLVGGCFPCIRPTVSSRPEVMGWADRNQRTKSAAMMTERARSEARGGPSITTWS